MRAGLVVLLVLLAGCVSGPVVDYERTRFGLPEAVVDGEHYPLTDEQQREYLQDIVDAYGLDCEVDPVMGGCRATFD